MGVGQGFLGGEGLGRDDEESGGRIALLQRLGHVGAVDVGHEMHPQVGMPVGLQRLARHIGAEVGASYPDIHHVGDLPAVMAGPGAVADGLGEPAHLRQNPVDVGHDIAPVHHHRPVGAVAERRMQDRAVFRGVDPFAREHVVTPAGDILLAGKVEQQAHGFLGDAVLGVVEQEAVQTRRETGGPLGIALEQVAHMNAFHLGAVSGESLPRGGIGQSGHGDISSRFSVASQPNNIRDGTMASPCSCCPPYYRNCSQLGMSSLVFVGSIPSGWPTTTVSSAAGSSRRFATRWTSSSVTALIRPERRSR